MVELRKRPAPPAAAPPAKKKAAPKSKAKKEDATTAEAVAEEQPAVADNAAVEDAAKDAPAEPKAKTSSSPPKQGDKIDLEGFGGEIETNDGEKTTLAQLAKSSKKGVVLFTYPKASTPYVSAEVTVNLTKKPQANKIIQQRLHNPSLPLPRLLRATNSHWARNLRPQHRQSQSKHHFQNQAELALFFALRPGRHSD
jgi:hypothetical protein